MIFKSINRNLYVLKAVLKCFVEVNHIGYNDIHPIEKLSPILPTFT